MPFTWDCFGVFLHHTTSHILKPNTWVCGLAQLHNAYITSDIPIICFNSTPFREDILMNDYHHVRFFCPLCVICLIFILFFCMSVSPIPKDSWLPTRNEKFLNGHWDWCTVGQAVSSISWRLTRLVWQICECCYFFSSLNKMMLDILLDYKYALVSVRVSVDFRKWLVNHFSTNFGFIVLYAFFITVWIFFISAPRGLNPVCLQRNALRFHASWFHLLVVFLKPFHLAFV